MAGSFGLGFPMPFMGPPPAMFGAPPPLGGMPGMMPGAAAAGIAGAGMAGAGATVTGSGRRSSKALKAAARAQLQQQLQQARSGCYKMLVARVALGKQGIGQAGMRKPPEVRLCYMRLTHAEIGYLAQRGFAAWTCNEPYALVSGILQLLCWLPAPKELPQQPVACSMQQHLPMGASP